MKSLRGYLWITRKYGIKRAWAYYQARRHHVIVDYAQEFTPDELARIGEHIYPAPWEQ